MKKNQGFTLLELLMTISIVGILAAVAVPAFTTTIANARLTSTINGLVGALGVARSEAIEAGVPVIVEVNGDGGWQLRNTATNEVLRTLQPAPDDITVTGFNAVTFQANGYRAFGEGVETFQVCNKTPRCSDIRIETGGSVTLKSDT